MRMSSGGIECAQNPTAQWNHLNTHAMQVFFLDSDCGTGWKEFDNSCYQLFTDKQSWQNSSARCKMMGGNLGNIQNQKDQRFLAGNNQSSWDITNF